MKRSLWLCIVLVLFSTSALAELDDSLQTLKKTEQQLEEETHRKEELAKKIREIDYELIETKEKLISTAKLVRENENNLRDVEQRIVKLEKNKASMEEKLKSDRASISRLILALERIRRTPPEAMLARPESPYKTAQSALLMGELIPALHRHAGALQKNLETLDQVTKELNQERADSIILLESLQKQHETLSTLMETRENIYKQTHQDIQAREASIQKISLQARNLEDLVDQLKEEEMRERARMDAEEEERAKAAKTEKELAEKREKEEKKYAAVLSKGSGESQLPIAGTIKISYKEKDDLGASSNGLTIEGRSGALVVAPIQGKIQFAGPFKKYGNIVIIEHENGFHSLVAGLEKIDTLVGEHVESGEPIGVLPTPSSPDVQPKLYYELRQNGKPVNPSIKFANLG